MNEDYVSLEVAKLLKEKGFKHWCYKSYGDAVYYKGVPISFDEECELKSEGLEDEIEYVEGGYLYDFGCDNRKKEAKVWAAPTLQRAMKWLRAKHCIIVVNPTWFTADGCKKWSYSIWADDNLEVDGENPDKRTEYDSYEETCDAAIKYCLENLI